MTETFIIIAAVLALALIAAITCLILTAKKLKKERAEKEELQETVKKDADEKQQLDAESRILIRNISHDLKTPITSIKGYAGGIIDGVASTPEKLDKYAHTIYTKACDMDALIDELTVFSEINMNRAVYKFGPLEIKEFLEKYAEENRDDLEQQGIEISFYSYLADPEYVIADPEKLRRVMNNIIGNSVKYMDKKPGFIGIRLRAADRRSVLIEVEDNGRGVDEKDLPYIFDRFYRADESRTSPTKGSGIGLSIVKKIIEDHGGKIRATSTQGLGTVIHFTLRLVKEK